MIKERKIEIILNTVDFRRKNNWGDKSRISEAQFYSIFTNELEVEQC